MATTAWTQKRLEQQRVRRALAPLSDEQKLKARARAKEWYQRNKERAKPRIRTWKKENPERVKASNSRSYVKHKDERLAAGKRWRQNHLEYYRVRALDFYRKNSTESKLRNHERRTRRRALLVDAGSFSVAEWRAKVRSCENKCYYCHVRLTRRSETVDHMIPISRGGSNTVENVVPACLRCNLRKNRLTAEEFQARLGGKEV